MFGSHLSIAKGMGKAVEEAVRLTFDTIQVFAGKSPSQWHMTPISVPPVNGQNVAKNQQQWSVRPLEQATIDSWTSACKTANFQHVVAHDSYLINLASPDPVLRAKSIELFAEEIRRCEQLGIPYLVSHPGAHMGKRDDPSDEAAGIARVAEALLGLLDRFPKAKTTICLESTAGQGSSLGHRLEHLRDMLDATGRSDRIGICLDTAHLFAAGYDLRTADDYRRLRDQLEATVGLDRVKVWHLNDSKKPLGSRVDRHEHIGHGAIGEAGFAAIVADKRWADVPKILETAKEEDEAGRPWDAVNLETLRRLQGV